MNRFIIKLAKRVFPQSMVQQVRQWDLRRRIALFRPYLVSKPVGDVKLDFWIADAVGQLWYGSKEITIFQEMKFIRDRMIAPGDVVMDCGAHHGYTALLFAKWLGNTGKVLAFEASKHNYRILKKNIKLNNISNIYAYNAAVGDVHGKINISIDYNANVATDQKGEVVEMLPLDAFQDAIPTFIKIDVEGFEAFVLKGAQEILRRHPKIAMEVHTPWLHRYHSSIDDIFAYIDVKSYQVYIQWDENQPPQPYRQEDIDRRVHLFFLPR